MSNFSNRVKNLEEILSGFHKEDNNINKLTKQTLFDHLNNVAMSSNSNTRSARVNAVRNNIENQISKQHNTKLFKNLHEVEAEELQIDSVALEVEEMLKNYRKMKNKKVPAPLNTSGKGDRTENLDGDGDDSEDDDDCDDDGEIKLDYDTKHSIVSIDKANNSSNDGNNNRINSNVHVQKKELLQSSEAKGNGNVVLCNQMAFIRNQIRRSPCLDE